MKTTKEKTNRALQLQRTTDASDSAQDLHTKNGCISTADIMFHEMQNFRHSFTHLWEEIAIVFVGIHLKLALNFMTAMITYLCQQNQSLRPCETCEETRTKMNMKENIY